MQRIELQTRENSTVRVSSDELATTAARMEGDLLTPAADDYDEFRTLWNATIECRPAIIARCRNTEDVVHAVNFAREHDAAVAIRSGGHNVAGTSTVKGGFVIDLQEMNEVTVDTDARIAHVQGGATLGDVDRATQKHGLITPSGFVSDTGIAGLTLRGGLGHTMRRFGMTCDNLVSVELVTSDGEVIEADDETAPDVMWALRGGPMDLGVVTSFRYRIHPVGPRVRLMMCAYPAERGVEINQLMRDEMKTAPRELGMISFYATLPDEEELPEAVRDEDVIVLFSVYTGSEHEADATLQPFTEHPALLADLGDWMDYTEAQTVLDEDYPNGMRYYWKSLYLDELTDDALEDIHRLGETMPSPLSTLDVWTLGGAIEEIDPDTSCFPMRNASHMIAIEANWEDPENDEANIEWARQTFDELKRHSGGGIYMNFPGNRTEQDQAVESVYRGVWDRLQEVKRRLDPVEFF